MAKKKTPKATYKGIGGGRYKVTDPKSKNRGKVFTKDPAGNHVYKLAGGRTKVVGKRTVPFDASAPIKTEAEYQQRIGAAQTLKYGQAESQLAGQQRASVQTQANVGSWWQDYQRQVGEANARQQAYAQGAQQAVYNQANTSRAQDGAQAAQMDQAGQAAAQLRGTTQSPSVAPQAAAGRQALNNSFGGLIAAQGVAQGAYGASQYGTAGGLRAQALTQELGNRRKLDEQGRQMAVEKGAYGQEYGQKLRDAEHTKKLEIAAYGLNEQKAAAQVADQAADNSRQDKILKTTAQKNKLDARDKDRKFKLDQKKYGSAEAKRKFDERYKLAHPPGSGRGGSGGKGSFTPVAVRGNKAKLRSATQLAKDTGDAKPGKGGDLRQYLASKDYKDPILSQVAVETAIYGGVISKGLRARFKHEYGFAPKLGHRAKKKKAVVGPKKNKGINIHL